MMTSQQQADILLAEYQASKFRLAVTRSEALHNFYTAERDSGVDHMTAHERMAEHAKRLDFEEELKLIVAEMERAS